MFTYVHVFSFIFFNYRAFSLIVVRDPAYEFSQMGGHGMAMAQGLSAALQLPSDSLHPFSAPQTITAMKAAKKAKAEAAPAKKVMKAMKAK